MSLFFTAQKSSPIPVRKELKRGRVRMTKRIADTHSGNENQTEEYRYAYRMRKIDPFELRNMNNWSGRLKKIKYSPFSQKYPVEVFGHLHLNESVVSSRRHNPVSQGANDRHTAVRRAGE